MMPKQWLRTSHHNGQFRSDGFQATVAHQLIQLLWGLAEHLLENTITQSATYKDFFTKKMVKLLSLPKLELRSLSWFRDVQDLSHLSICGRITVTSLSAQSLHLILAKIGQNLVAVVFSFSNGHPTTRKVYSLHGGVIRWICYNDYKPTNLYTYNILQPSRSRSNIPHIQFWASMFPKRRNCFIHMRVIYLPNSRHQRTWENFML